MPLLLDATSLKKKTKKNRQIAKRNLLAKSLNKPAPMTKGLLPDKNTPMAAPEQTQPGQLTSLPTRGNVSATGSILPMPGQGGLPTRDQVSAGGEILPPQPKTGMMDYWKQPVFGKMPLDQFSGLTGSLAHAIAPGTAQGRVGKIFGDRGNRMYDLRLGRELKAEDVAEKRGYLGDVLKEERRYDEGVSEKEWERGAPGRALDTDFRKAQTRALNRSSEAERSINRYMAENPTKSYKDASEWYARRGEGEPTDTGKSAFQDVHSLLTSIGNADADGSYTIPVDSDGHIPPAVREALAESGVNYNLSEITKTDKPWLFTGDNYSKKIVLGSYDPEKAETYKAKKEHFIDSGFEQVSNKKGETAWINRKTGETLDFDTGKITKAKKKSSPPGGDTVGNLLKSKAQKKVTEKKEPKPLPKFFEPGAPNKWLMENLRKLPGYIKKQADMSGQ